MPNPTEFRRALTKLSTNATYRNRAIKDPTIITKDFNLSVRDLQALRQAAVMSGADVTEVNRVRAAAVARSARPGRGPQQTLAAPSGPGAGCCCCCCCCCGETAVAPPTASCI